MADRKKSYERNGQVDFILLMVIVCLLLFGLVMLFSASSPKALREGNIYSIIIKQGGISLLGCFLMAAASEIDYHRYKKYARVIIVLTGIVMYVVPLFGFASHGARRQIAVGPISFQPSEVAKFALVIYYSARLSDRKTSDLKNLKNLAKYFGILGIYLLACVLQSHMSAAVVLAIISVMLLFAAGLSGKLMGTVFVVMLPLATWLVMSEEYRLNRIRALFRPFDYSRDIGWQIIQSLYAVGSGGLFGLGLGQSRQKYQYLPEAHNDYIYAIACEELGFIGGITIIALFVLFVWRGISIALNARDRFGMLMAFGITSIVGVQMLINIGVVLSVLPSTGMQLPFFSAGGTSMLIMLAGMGVLLNISRTSRVKKI